MTSIERTAYPQFKRLTTARVLHVSFTPAADEVAWAQERTASPESLLALVVDLKCFQKMARFCSREEIPQVVTGHVRHCLGLAPEVEPDHGAARTAKWHRKQVRERQGVTYDQRRARAVAAAAIREAAVVKNHPPDLINVALERLVESSLELPAFSTLDEMATSIRAEVNAGIFAGIVSRMGADGRQRAQGLLATAGPDGRSMFDRLKKPAQRATWSRFKAQAEYLDQVDELGDTARWLEGGRASKGRRLRRRGGCPGRRHAVAVRGGQAAGAGGVPGAHRADAGPLTVSGITQVVLATGADAGIPGLRPHRCRHTFATLLRRGGAGPAQVQAMLGHASVDTAARYFRSGAAENAAVIERIFDQ